MSKPRVRIGTLPALVSLLFITAGVLPQISQTSCRSVAKQTSSAFSGESLTVLPDVPVDMAVRQHEVLHVSVTMPVNIQTWPTPMKDIEPAYPNQARASAVEGTAMVNLHVTESGGVDSVGVYKSSGSRLLDDAALEAALKCTFTRALDLQRRPVGIWVRRPFRFHLGPVYYYDELVTGPYADRRVFTPPSPFGYSPPGYPELSRRKGEGGTVVLGIWLRKDGTVSVGQVWQSSGHPPLDSVAARAMFKSVFTPARDSAGDAVNTWVRRTVNFSPKRP